MSVIAGFYSSKENYLESENYRRGLLEQMSRALYRRSAGDFEQSITASCGVTAGHGPEQSQPVFFQYDGYPFLAVCDGEIYNREELSSLRNQCGSGGEAIRECTTSPAEIMLREYLEHGPDFIRAVNGIFSAAIYDGRTRRLLLYRDRFGVKPLFYTMAGQTLVFASEIKALLCYPGVKPELDRQGLNEVFSIGPARTCGCGIFRGIREVLPGHYLLLSLDGIANHCYWELESHPHKDDYETTVSHVRELLTDAVTRQMDGKASLCSFLSGGVDSSLVSAICAAELKKSGERLTTYSFDFADSEKYFKANSFQPSLDAPYVQKMAEYLGSDHHVLTCTTQEQASALSDSVLAHDLPNMADVDSSLLCFCSKVGKHHSIALTGECADEIFGGYPWFHKEECLNAGTFPWTMDLNARKVLLSDDFIEYLGMEDYVAETYRLSVAETPLCPGESESEDKRRRISYLNLKWFMQTLLNRMDRDGSHAGLAARVPFADYRIVEYLFNVPWEMKAHGGIVKGLLRDAGKGLLPDEILFRRKSPYPKTYDTGYEKLLVGEVRRMMEDSSAPVLNFLDKKKVETFLKSPSDYGRPWYGQLMAAPQMLAYILQVNFWLEHYQVKILA